MITKLKKIHPQLMNALDFYCKCIVNLLTSATEFSVEDAADVEAIILHVCEWECATACPIKRVRSSIP